MYQKLENDIELAISYYDNLKKKVSFSKEDLISIIKGIHYGISRIKLGELYNLSGSTITYHLKKANIVFENKYKPHPNGISQDTINILISRFEQGNPIYKLAKEFNIQKNLIAKLLKENNVDTEAPSFDINVFDIIDTEEKAY
jgi:hypothetical protein